MDGVADIRADAQFRRAFGRAAIASGTGAASGVAMTRPTFIVLVLASIAACYPKPGPAPGALSPNTVALATQKWPGTTEMSLAAGHDTFIAKCNDCHKYPDIASIREERWPGIMKSMGHKARLSPQDADNVLHFILAARAGT